MPEQSWGSWALSPTTNVPSRAAKQVSDWISPSNEEGSPLRGFLSGAVEGVGNLADDMTSPASIAGTAAGVAPWMRGAKVLTNLGRINELRNAGSTATHLPAGMIAEGGEAAYNAANAARSTLPKMGRSADDIAYESIMNLPNKIRSSIGGSFNSSNIPRSSVGGGMDTINEMRRIKEFRDAAKVTRGEVSTR